MKVKFTYPVQTGVVTLDRWPIRLGDLVFEWLGEDGRITSVAVTAPVSEADSLPTVEQNPQPDVALNINPGRSERFEEVEQALRAVQGLADLFGRIAIDFDRGEVAWVPESAEERSRLPLLSFSMTREAVDLNTPRLATFDMLARSVAAARAASDHEVPLSFLRRGTRDAHAGRHIEAFYNLFFFLETLYAPGYSDPKKVRAKLNAATAVRAGLSEMRSALAPGVGNRSGPKLARLLAMDDERLIGHLVETRGNLHHHAPRKPGVWHPDRPRDFEAEVEVLLHTAHAIALKAVLPILFAREQDEALMASAEHAGVVVELRAEVAGLVDGRRRTFEPLALRLPGARVHRPMVHAAHRHLRRLLSEHFSDVEVLEFRIASADGMKVYAVYRRPESPA